MLPVQNQSQTEMGVSERSRVLDYGVQPRLRGNFDIAGDRDLAAEPGKWILVEWSGFLSIRQHGDFALAYRVPIGFPGAITAGTHHARVHRNGSPQASLTDGAGLQFQVRCRHREL